MSSAGEFDAHVRARLFAVVREADPDAWPSQRECMVLGAVSRGVIERVEAMLREAAEARVPYYRRERADATAEAKRREAEAKRALARRKSE